MYIGITLDVYVKRPTYVALPMLLVGRLILYVHWYYVGRLIPMLHKKLNVQRNTYASIETKRTLPMLDV